MWDRLYAEQGAGGMQDTRNVRGSTISLSFHKLLTFLTMLEAILLQGKAHIVVKLFITLIIDRVLSNEIRNFGVC